ncbi:MAG: NUDIX domain-containing protein, partial [Candidatus Poribacteria bacterium]|nr:NUDIX domain-containing protein [Candidatus Poribacteria bacterium]
MTKKYLSRDDYFRALSLTQLVSIDLLIVYHEKLLVGKRSNNPAQGSLFVPGGKVYKNEYLTEGLERISKQEIGFSLNTNQVQLKGIYDHIYENNFRDDTCGTHYVTIACQVELPLEQQQEVRIVENAMLA